MPTNEYYDSTGVPASRAALSSATMRAEFDKIEDGFCLLPVLSGNESLPVFVNAAGTELEAVTGAMPLTSGQITFPAVQNPSAGANVLDDYEENTWVAAFAAGTGTITINSSYDEGSYVKIGKCVNILGTFKVTSVSSPDAEFTLSLPMSSGATPDITIIPVVVTGLASNSFTGFYGRIDSSAPDVVTIVGKTAGGDDATIANYVQADTTVVVGGGYLASE